MGLEFLASGAEQRPAACHAGVIQRSPDGQAFVLDLVAQFGHDSHQVAARGLAVAGAEHHPIALDGHVRDRQQAVVRIDPHHVAHEVVAKSGAAAGPAGSQADEQLGALGRQGIEDRLPVAGTACGEPYPQIFEQHIQRRPAVELLQKVIGAGGKSRARQPMASSPG